MLSQPDSSSSIKVLLVEDNPGDARLIREYLNDNADQSVEVDHADTLAGAIECIGAKKPDAILLDLGLPDSVGLETVNRLREAASAVPVIVLTGLEDGEISLSALKEGAQDYLCKSEIQGDLLPSILRHAIERQRLLNALAQQSERLMATNWALIDSERRFKAFLDASPDSICIKDAEGRYILGNPEFVRRMRLSGTDWIGGTADDIYGPEWAAVANDHDRKVLDSGKDLVVEVDIHPVLGAELVERVVKFPLRGADGEIIGLGVIGVDITDRKRAELALSKSVRALRVLSSCNEILVRAEAEDWLLNEICRAIGEIGGYPLVWVGFVEESGNGNLRPVASFGDSEIELGAFHASCTGDPNGQRLAEAAILGGEAVIAREGIECSACGPVAHLATRKGSTSGLCLPLVDQGKTIGALSIYSHEPDCFGREEVDLLTEMANDLAFGIHSLRQEVKRGAAEAELRKLSRAVEQSPNIVIITDEDGIIEYVNPKFTEVTGYTADEAVGQNPRILKSGETGDQDYQALWTTVAEGREWRGIFHNKCKDGSLYWAEAVISPIRDPDGKITNLIGVQQDISHRMLTEQKLRQSEKMEALGSLAGGIAHDFNNMLLPILTLSKMAMRDFPEDSKQYNRLQGVVEAAERASELVRRILTFSRTAEVEKKDANLAEIVDHSLDLLRATLPSTIDLRTRIDSNIGTAEVDQAQLQTIILNLASNSADAMAGTTGRLEIGLERIKLSERQGLDGTQLSAGTYAKLTVADNGPGIPEKIRSRVFEPFFTTKGIGEGTGLGLAMVHGIVTEHGGAVLLDSEEGEGTRIEIFLPMIDAEAPAVPAD